QIPASAPIYDELTRPVSFPRLYCMSSTDPATYAREFGRMAHAVVNGTPTVCQCYTQQSTRVATDFEFCQRVVENGFFDPTLPDRSAGSQPPQIQQARQPALPPSQPVASESSGGTRLTVVPYQKGRFLW
ncbi:zonular occludens toxin, partial [Stutzerimonas balearica]